jgi:hypothetical protein
MYLFISVLNFLEMQIINMLEGYEEHTKCTTKIFTKTEENVLVCYGYLLNILSS